MGRELTGEEMIDLIEKLITNNLERGPKQNDLEGLKRIIEGDFLRRNQGHSRCLAEDPGEVLRVETIIRSMFFETTGVDSSNFED